MAQVRPCGQPIADYLFQQRRSNVNQPVADAQKLIRAKKAVEENCLTSVQIRDLAQLFQSEEARLDFARHAFFYAFDQDNYYEVYNAFARFSNAFRLHDYVLSQRNTVFNPTPNNPSNPSFPPVSNPLPNLIFPAYDYPNYYGYTGPQNCNFPMSDYDFYQVAQEVQQLPNENARQNRLSSLAGQSCMVTEQAMKLASMLQSENNRMIFLKMAWPRIYDAAHFIRADQLFSQPASQQGFRTFVQSQTGNNFPNTPTTNPNNPPNAGCVVSAAEFNDIKTRIGNEISNSTRLSTAKTIIQVKQCFTSAQILELLGLFPFSSSKMELAKFAYDFTVDKDRYYTLSDAFSFSSDREELMRFINSKR
ncbi:MAG: hypothetical protein OHK0053_14450 [Microscillaceae bacterium]